MITEKEYRKAAEIYLLYAYPDSPDVRKSCLDELDNTRFFEDGMPSEVRWGCYANMHMKLRVRWHPGKGEKFEVDRNDFQDGEDVKAECKKIKIMIEKKWREEGLQVAKDY